jgi:glycosyltransferase involved in cell wall biosynthesis
MPRRAAKHFFNRGRRFLERVSRRLQRIERRVVTVPAAGRPVARALFSYILDPLLAPSGAALSHSHTHFWESREMVRTLSELGFTVDTIHWTNTSFVPRESYDVFVDVRLQLERLAPFLPPRTLKLLHAETGHWRFYNAAQARRREALAERRGIHLAPYKTLEENRAIETAEGGTILGNEATISTYAFAGKPLLPVPISQPFLYPFPQSKDYESARRRFVWFGSGGLLHKGLDRVLEVFAELPDFALTVLGPIEREPEFERAFARELYRTPNIRTLGWIDVGSPRFLEVAREHVALVYPSCSEGQNGGTVTCMHAGLIPIVSRESGVDVTPMTGVVLERSTLDEIRARVLEIAARSPAALEATALKSWQWVRAHHTRERFAAAYRDAVLQLVARLRPELRRSLDRFEPASGRKSGETR